MAGAFAQFPIERPSVTPEPDVRTCEYNDETIIRLYTYEWTIPNYSLITKFPVEATSPDFAVGQHDAEVMALRFSSVSENNLKIEILMRKARVLGMGKSDKYVPFRKADLNLEFLDSKGKTLDYYYMGLPKEYKYVKKRKSYVWKKEANVSRIVDNDVLRIRAKLSLRYSVSEKDKIFWSKSVEQLSNDMKKLNGGSLFPDLSIKVGGQSILAHKSILLPQIPYIINLNEELKAKQREVSSIESKSSIPNRLKEGYESICIPNESTAMFNGILHYLYCGKILTTSVVNDFDLYEFAQKYKLYELSKHLKPDGISACSQTKPSKITFCWHINEYTVRSLDRFNLLQSSVYKIRVGTEEISWIASLFFFDFQSISLSLQRAAGNYKDVQTIFKFIVCNPDGSPHEEREFKHFFASQLPTSFPGFLDPGSRFSINKNLLFDDTLMLRCELTVSDGQLATEFSRTYSGEVSRFEFKSWFKNLQALLDTGNFSDVNLLVGDEEFLVHKAVLSARSPVFNRMFQTDMFEKITGSVKIEDVSSSAMKCALKYMYTGKLDVMTMDSAPEVYRAADKYELLDLRDRCEEFIMENLDVDSASRVLILSDFYNDAKMREAAKNMICRNASQSLLTSSGQELMNTYPHLARNVLDNLSMAFLLMPPQDTYDNIEHEVRTSKISLEGNKNSKT